MRWAALLAGLTLAASAAAQTPQVEGRTEPLTITLDERVLIGDGPVWWRGQHSRVGSAWLRFHVAPPEGAGGSDAVLLFQGGQGRSFAYALDRIGEGGLWTGLLPGGAAVISLIAERRPTGLSVAIDEVSFEAETGTLFSTWGTNELTPIHAPEVPEEARALAGPVAKLVFQNAGVPRSCTGFLVAENALLTNEHCINSLESCQSLVALFGYEYDAENRLSFGEQFGCAGFEPARVSWELDASLVRLTGSPGATWGTVELPESEPAPERPLMVIQHPGGQPKQVSVVECAAMAVPVDGRAPGTDFTHTCDTAGGSSGAPVFDRTGTLVGLHHYGFAEGQVADWTENRGIRISRVRDWIAGLPAE